MFFVFVLFSIVFWFFLYHLFLVVMVFVVLVTNILVFFFALVLDVFVVVITYVVFFFSFSILSFLIYFPNSPFFLPKLFLSCSTYLSTHYLLRRIPIMYLSHFPICVFWCSPRDTCYSFHYWFLLSNRIFLYVTFLLFFIFF